MPRRALLLLGLVASVASAQSPADSSEVVRDSVVVVETLVRQPGERIERERVRIDSVVTRREAPAQRARLAFPTEGGVFYYRAGSGSAIRRVQRAAPAERSEAERTPLGEASPETVAPSPARAGEGPAAQPAQQGVTQGDLDRLERRLLDAMNRRLDGEARNRPPVPGMVPAARPERPPAGEGRPTDQPVPISPADSLRRVPRSSLDDAPEVNDDPEVTADVVERAILDTGLFRTSRVFFAFGEADLLPVSQRVLDTIAEVLLRYPDLRIEVGGHTDWVSSEAFNLELSQRRAGSVVDYLMARGVDAGRILAVGYGETRPVATNETETGRALNRRVEFVVLAP